jgi:hypothetical protein
MDWVNCIENSLVVDVVVTVVAKREIIIIKKNLIEDHSHGESTIYERPAGQSFDRHVLRLVTN